MIKRPPSVVWWLACLPLDPRDILLRVQTRPRTVDFLWVIKIPSTHFLQRGSKAVGHSVSEMLCRPNFLTRFSPVIFSCFTAKWLWLLNQADSKKCCGSRLATCSSNTLNHGTVLTAACALRGCSATEWVNNDKNSYFMSPHSTKLFRHYKVMRVFQSALLGDMFRTH
jgi:hypothetical protein